MKLQKLEIKKLYGFMDKSIDFNDKLNLLVGINGSGKTSVLNVISWLMQPSFTELCTTEFEQLKLIFSYEGSRHTITCDQTEKKLQIHVKVDNKSYPVMVTDLRFPTALLASNPSLKEAFSPTYESRHPQHQEIETWSYFLHLPNPIIISIDRKFEHKPDKPSEQKLKTKPAALYGSSLEVVKKYSNEAYSKYNKKVIDLNKVLRDKILLSSFESSIIDLKDPSNTNHKLSVRDVDRLEKNITKFLDEDTSNNETSIALKNAIRKYAYDMRNIINDYFGMRKSKDPAPLIVTDEKGKRTVSSIATTYFINSNQFVRIQKLLIAFSRYEQDSNEAYKIIDIYLKSINHFLSDSNKELLFKKENGQLYFNLKNKNNQDFKYEQSIDSLSSGEKQILILFTYLAFGDTKGKIFIIDEPEISLHPKWQDDFLQQLNNVTPSDTQLIIATHSPSIVGELEENCKVLLPYNE